MSTDEVQALRRDFDNLRDEVRAMKGTLELIHTAVANFAGKTYAPGPSLWRRLSSWVGRGG